MAKVLQFDNGISHYISLAREYADKEKYFEALSLLFDALEKENNAEIYELIAEIYANLEMYELSNQYWFYYLDIAKEEDKAKAYEELAINYYDMDNIFVSGYYLHKKLKIDGKIDAEDFAEEISNTFNEEIDNKKLFKIVYPPKDADYTEIYEKGDKAFLSGDHKKAYELLSKIPSTAKEYADALEEGSISQFFLGDVESAIESNKKLAEIEGKQVIAYSNISSFYNFKGNTDKSKYYYNKALEINSENKEDQFKLATVSLEQNEFSKACNFFEKVIKDRPSDLKLKYLYGIALINDRNIEKANEIFKSIYLIDRESITAKYYFDLTCQAKKDSSVLDKLLPITCDGDVPKKTRIKWSKKLVSLRDKPLKELNKELKKEDNLFILKWALQKGDNKDITNASFILGFSNNKICENLMKKSLLNFSLSDTVKRALLYLIFVNGNKEKINILCEDILVSVKAQKMPCESDKEIAYFVAYCWCLSRLVFLDLPEYKKLAISTNKIYKTLKGKIVSDDYSRDLMAGLILYVAKLDKFSNLKEICRLFEVVKKDMKILIDIYEKNLGENNEKDN